MRALVNALQSGRVHHAFLFTGTRGVGKTTIARILAKSLNCETGMTPTPCGTCTACREIDEGRFVDLIEVDAASRTKVDDTRELLDNVQYAPARGRYKVYLIDEVHMLSTHSFNALLKTLEEPPPRTLLALVASQPSRLPATIISRCQRIRVRPPARAQSLAWLQQSRGGSDWAAVLDVIGEAPLLAAALDPGTVASLRKEVEEALAAIATGRADPVPIAGRWARSELSLRLACIENWLTERIRRSMGVSAEFAKVRPGAHLSGPESAMNIRSLFELLQRVRELRDLLDTPINTTLALESLLHAVQAANMRERRA